MQPFLTGNQDVDSGWIGNPDPDIYSSWEELAKAAVWDLLAVGEVFFVATAHYATGWPARWHVAPPWTVEVDLDRGRRRYRIGRVELGPEEILHLRYKSTVDDARGHGPLEAVRARMVAADVLARYATSVASTIPPSVLKHEDELTAEKAADLKAQWVAARLSSVGEPAVLDAGVDWQTTSVSPKDMALLELSQFNESRIAIALGVPPHILGLPAGGDSLTYTSTAMLYDHHWSRLRPTVKLVTRGLSEWLLPRGTFLEVNSDSYVRPGPKERAETAAILNGIVDPMGNPVLTVEQIQAIERIPIAEAGPLG